MELAEKSSLTRRVEIETAPNTTDDGGTARERAARLTLLTGKLTLLTGGLTGRLTLLTGRLALLMGGLTLLMGSGPIVRFATGTC